MKMTQIIWYRSQTAPELPSDEAQRVAWEKEIPDAKFITIAPDHLREAFWSKISRPVQGIMYHGWGSLVPAEHGGYRHTNPETREALTQLIRDVVRPLGPTLLQVPDRSSDVAILESFAAQVFAGRGTARLEPPVGGRLASGRHSGPICNPESFSTRRCSATGLTTSACCCCRIATFSPQVSPPGSPSFSSAAASSSPTRTWHPR